MNRIVVGKTLELFTATKGTSYVALLYVDGEEREALNIEGTSRAEAPEFRELAAVTTAIKCLTVSRESAVRGNLSGPIGKLELFLENYQLYRLLKGQASPGRHLRAWTEFVELVRDSREFIFLRLLDSCALDGCALHRSVENAYDRANDPGFEMSLLNSKAAPGGVLLPKYAHQSSGPVQLPQGTLGDGNQ